MINLNKHPLAKYPLFSSLYFSQGIIYALATVIINVYLDNQGVPDTIIGLIIAIVYIPWVVKFFFGGIVDHFIKIGRRKFIIFGGCLSVISFFILSFIDPNTSIVLFTLILLIASSGIAFLDVSADAWAIEITDEKERGKINGVMFAGLFLGMAVTSIVIGSIAENYGYPFSFIITALIVLVIIAFPIFVEDTVIPKRKEKMKKLLITEFKKPNTQLITIFLPISAISFGLLAVVVPQYMNDVLMLSVGQIGLLMAVGPLATVFGNIVGGFLADHWGRKESLYLTLSLNLFFAAALVFADTWQKLAIIWLIVGFLHGGHYSAFGALSMDVTNPKVGASQYSIMMGIGNAGEMTGTFSSGILISSLGFSRVFLYSGIVYGPALLILRFIKSTIKNGKKK